MSGNYLSHIKVTNDRKSYCLLSETIDGQNETKFELTFISSDESLNGIIDFEEYKRKNASNESMDELNEKHKRLLEAMRLGSKQMSTNDGSYYCYEFDISSDNSIHICLSIYENEELMAKSPLFDMKCKKLSTTESMAQLMSKMVTIFQSKDQLIDELKHQNKSLRQLCEKSVQSLDDFTVNKEENDSLVFTKFVAILNEKKNKIKQLEEEMRSE